MSAVVADIEMPSQKLGPAGQEVVDNASMLQREYVPPPIRLTEGTEYVRYLEARALCARLFSAARRALHRALPESLLAFFRAEEVDRALGGLDVALADVRVARRGSEGRMAKHDLDRAQVGA